MQRRGVIMISSSFVLIYEYILNTFSRVLRSSSVMFLRQYRLFFDMMMSGLFLPMISSGSSSD